ncbi:GGDEF domain-containing protein [Devosia nitrariae]|uniref:diguanylate cyclase n=1 Tax=Devosia nitrariae TaxID=2071872 RepID=A0ABQ5W2F5_9HYPH|nr:GGDEF domain-containing protein [Devosia nitrariae]GLQ54049.1 GGDEF domain-containing protein [Devosia nitrariae]
MLDLSSTGKARVYLGTIGGTLLCIAVALLIDGFDFATGRWRWGSEPLNNILIPGVLAPPLLFLLLSQMRQLALAHREVLTAASTDSLTQCLNRRAFTAMVEGYIASVTGDAALLVIDVDFFKSVNDRFGHDKGDEALGMVAQAIKGSVRSTDLVARMGGEEFSVFLPATDLTGARVAGEAIRQRVAAVEITVDGELLHLSVSVGGVAFAAPAAFAELYRAADQLMYLAKGSGRDRTVLDTFGAA